MTPADQREPLVEGPAVPLEAGGRDAAGDPARSPVAIFSAHSRLLPNGATSRYSVRSFHSPAGPVDRDGHIADHSTSRSGQPAGSKLFSFCIVFLLMHGAIPVRSVGGR